ncbi:TPA: hypothetical protein MM131_001437 [Klebsiella variicola subsp. variicola]|nr:hypothetical protein [Klebsiella variicola subsp. variicola]
MNILKDNQSCFDYEGHMRKQIGIMMLLSLLSFTSSGKEIPTSGYVLSQLQSGKLVNDERWIDKSSVDGKIYHVIKSGNYLFSLSNDFLEVAQSVDPKGDDSEDNALKVHTVCIMIATIGLKRNLTEQENSTVIDTVSGSAQIVPTGAFSSVDGFDFYSLIKAVNGNPVFTCGLRNATH